ncbi:hypothetical protein ACOMHN_015895 [Nucella lapillus]
MASKDDSHASGNNSDSGNSGSGGGVGGMDSVDLTCPVCYDTYRSPRFLPCHHTLCTQCIGDLLERAARVSNFFLCPLCQVRVPIPEDGVTSFQVNFYLAPFLSGRVSASLAPQQLKDVGRTPPDSSNSPGSSFDLSCEAHWSGAWSQYCRVCAALVCGPSCAQHQGPDHSVVPVSEEAPAQRSEVRRQLLSLTTLQGALADLEEECKHRVTALEESCGRVVREVEGTRQQVCSALGARASKASEKVQGLRGRIGKVVEGEMKHIQEKRHALAALLTSASEVMAASDAEFLRRKTKLTARVQWAMSKVPPARGHPQFSFKMNPALQPLLRTEGSFGYMTLHFQSPVLRHKLTLASTKQDRKLRKLCPRGDGTMLASVGNCLVTVSADLAESQRLEFPGEVLDFAPSRDGFVYVVLPFPSAVKRLNTSTDVAADFVSPLNPPTALACTDKGELVFASHDGKDLSLTFYSDSGARLRRVTLPKPQFSPLSMVVTKQGTLFLASASEILCLRSDFSELASLGGREGEGEEREGGGGGGGGGGVLPRSLSGLRGIGSGVGDVLVANAAVGNVEIVELSGDKLSRKEEIIQWKRGTSEEEEEADVTKGLLHRISCAVLDQSGKLWVGQEDGHVTVYDWLLRTS